MRPTLFFVAVVAVVAEAPGGLAATLQGGSPVEEPYLSWSAEQAVAIGKRMRANGRVGGFLDLRVVRTERSYNYKLRATWLTPEVTRAAARLAQIANRLSARETMALVAEAEAVGDTVLLVEIDPREGSGVIPLDWLAVLQPKGLAPEASGAARGVINPGLRELKALAGVFQRDYAYDQFWVVFPLHGETGAPLFSDSTQEAELVVRIYNKEGRVAWPIPGSIRERVRALLKRDKSG